MKIGGPFFVLRHFNISGVTLNSFQGLNSWKDAEINSA